LRGIDCRNELCMIEISKEFIVKKLLAFMTSAIVFASSVVAQPIVSIGNFKIGMTEEEFRELPDIKSKTVQDFSNYSYRSTDSDVWRKTNESRNSTYGGRIYSPEYVEYTFKMSTGVKDFAGKDSYGTKAIFYKNQMIEIRLDISGSSTQFTDILTEKYGKSIFVDGMKKETCQNGYGAKSEHNTGSLVWTWKSTGPVEANVSLSSFSCGKLSGAGYTVSDAQKRSFVRNLERDAEKNSINEEVKSKASSSTL
jgi:hypothetical protein